MRKRLGYFTAPSVWVVKFGFVSWEYVSPGEYSMRDVRHPTSPYADQVPEICEQQKLFQISKSKGSNRLLEKPWAPQEAIPGRYSAPEPKEPISVSPFLAIVLPKLAHNAGPCFKRSSSKGIRKTSWNGFGGAF